MTDNLALWHAVEKTPLDQTKPISGKQYKGTSPKPHYLVRKATETFGPCGIGWGFTVDERIEEGHEPGVRMHIAKVRVWYIWNDKRGEVEHIGGTVFAGKNRNGPFTDEDAPKKSVTDALIKALSMIGFAGDIFMGRYDDNKYIAELREEANGMAERPTHTAGGITAMDERTEVGPVVKSSAQSKKDGDWEKVKTSIDAATTLDELREAMKSTAELRKKWTANWQNMIFEYHDVKEAELRDSENVVNIMPAG